MWFPEAPPRSDAEGTEMKRLLSCLTIGLLLATPFAASADDNRHRDGHDRDFRHRQFDNRFQDRRFERNFGDHGFDRRFGDRHFDRSARLSHRNEPWRGHRGWSDYGGRRFDQFHPGSRAFDRFGSRGGIEHRRSFQSHDRHWNTQSHHPSRQVHSQSRRHQR
jgi:hypothetical protein